MAYCVHGSCPAADLNRLDRDALLALFWEQQEELDQLSAREQELLRLQAEVDTHRQTLSEQADELSSRSERIEHLS